MGYKTMNGFIKAVDDVSFNVTRGETLGIVGESACGKTSIGLSLIRVLPPNGEITGGHILLDGKDLLELSEDQMRQVRWNRISMIFQSAMNSLNPVFRVDDQLIGVLKAHLRVSKKEGNERVRELFELVGVSPSRAKDYPHQFSGGMKQRAIIAMSLICNPDVIVADEMTTALDVLVQDQILFRIKEMQHKLHFAMIVISHDISVIAETCQKIGVMYAGKLVEVGDSMSIFKDPHHPYTISLLQAFPSVKGTLRRLMSLPGDPPNLLNLPRGCRFRPRCPLAREICRKEPPKFEVTKGHYSRCHLASDQCLRKIRFKQ